MINIQDILYLLGIINQGGRKSKIALALILCFLRVPILLISLWLSISSIKAFKSFFIRNHYVPEPKSRGRGKRLSPEQREIKVAKRHPSVSSLIKVDFKKIS